MKKIMILVFMAQTLFSSSTSVLVELNEVSLDLTGIIQGASVERKKPVISDVIEGQRKEVLTEKPFKELWSNAFSKNLPWLLVTLVKGSSQGFSVDYLDGYNLLKMRWKGLSNPPFDDFKKEITAQISEVCFENEQAIVWAVNSLIYPQGHALRVTACLNNQPFDDMKNSIKIYFSKDNDARQRSVRFWYSFFDKCKLKGPKAYKGFNMVEIALAAKFWMNSINCKDERQKSIDHYLNKEAKTADNLK